MRNEMQDVTARACTIPLGCCPKNITAAVFILFYTALLIISVCCVTEPNLQHKHVSSFIMKKGLIGEVDYLFHAPFTDKVTA